MKIDLNIPKGAKQQLFLDYLNSQLRTRIPTSTGSISYLSDGGFESTLSGAFTIDQEQLPLTWQIVKSLAGELLFIKVTLSEDCSTNVNWEYAITEFITSVLTATLAERRKSFFRRIILNYIGPQLDGEYWLPGLRFAPVWPDDDQPSLLNAERVMALDMQIDAIDELDSMALADERARRYAARLSLLLDVGLYKTSTDLRWGMPQSNIIDKSVRMYMGFFGYGPQFTTMPDKGISCALGQYSGSLASRYRVAGERLSFPPEARKILRMVDSANPLITDAFDRSARLYHVAAVVGSQFPSVGLAYRVASVEAISKADSLCNGFSDFMRKYVTSTSQIDGLLDYLYGKARSAHFHAGEFPLGEYESQRYFDPLMDSDDIYQSNVHRMCFELTREAIVNWISSQLPEVIEENSMSTHTEKNN